MVSGVFFRDICALEFAIFFSFTLFNYEKNHPIITATPQRDQKD